MLRLGLKGIRSNLGLDVGNFDFDSLALPKYIMYLPGIFESSAQVDIVSRTPLVSTATGPLSVLKEDKSLVTYADDEVAVMPDGTIFNGGPITQSLVNPETPADQTTGIMGVNSYFLWVEGSGSVELTAGTAVVVGAGTATEAAGLDFSVTSLGTVDVTITGACTRFQIWDNADSLYPIFIDSATTTATRAGTTQLQDMAVNAPKLYDAADNVGATWDVDITPMFSNAAMAVATTLGIITVKNLLSGLLYFGPAGGGDVRIKTYDGTTAINIAVGAFASGDKIHAKVVTGTNHPSYPGVAKMQLQITNPAGVITSSAITDFDGSFDPGADFTIGKDNDYPFTIGEIKVRKTQLRFWQTPT